VLRITVEKVPYGVEEGSTVIHVGTITNDGSGTVTRGNYRAKFGNRANALQRETMVKGFPRKVGSAWYLLYLSLKEWYRPNDAKDRAGQIVRNLKDRSGFSGWWDGIDDDTQQEILDEIATEIRID